MSAMQNTTVKETESEYVVELDVSDFALKELSVELEDHEVTVLGEQESSNDAFRVHESFRLPADADAEWAWATRRSAVAARMSCWAL